jgi:hypothetical protein
MQVVEAQENKLTGYRLSPQQRRLWGLLRRGSNVSYQAKSAVAIKGHLESGRLKTTVRNVIARHEILRTVFRSLPGMTRLSIKPSACRGGKMISAERVSRRR